MKNKAFLLMTMPASSPHFKVIVVGDSGVGKTSFIVRFSEGKFLNIHDSTVGVDCKKVIVEADGKIIELHVWDTAGQERFRSIVSRFYRSADGALVMYDVTKQSTFDNVPWWVEDVNRSCPNIPIVIVGNKNDGAQQTEVLEELAQDFAESNQLYLFQSSARDNTNVAEAFRNLAIVMMRQKGCRQPQGHLKGYTALPSGDNSDHILLQKASKTSWSSCCSFIFPNAQQSLVV